jgi:hypothetical protein
MIEKGAMLFCEAWNGSPSARDDGIWRDAHAWFGDDLPINLHEAIANEVCCTATGGNATLR